MARDQIRNAWYFLESQVVTCAHGARVFVSDQRERAKRWRSPYLAVAPGHLTQSIRQ
jgi:hypothetical protein